MIENEVIIHLNSNRSIIAMALGGSRSRGLARADSDYDLFCIISKSDFCEFRNSFREMLESIPSILYAAEYSYLEHWGYLFKAVDVNGTDYDISLIPADRIEEISVRSTNIVLKDTDNLLRSCIEQADDSSYEISVLECQHRLDYSTLFGMEKKRFNMAKDKGDYWYCVRCLERMKCYLIRCDRIQRSSYPKTRNCPEKGYEDINDVLKRNYILDGTLQTAELTAIKICELFISNISDEELLRRSQLK